MSTLESTRSLERSGIVTFIVEQWDEKKNARGEWEDEIQELRNYLFATDTKSTSNADLPWKNSTTLPKLCQIRDNLHANYMSALFPNDNWLRWEGYSAEDEVDEKREAIQAYMANKVREGGFRDTISELLYDYIDTGMPIADAVFVNEQKEDTDTGEMIAGYVGPKAIRQDGMDIVFDLTSDFTSSWKISRKLMRIGELKVMASQQPTIFNEAAVEYCVSERARVASWTKDDHRKAESISIDGFGDLYTYLGSGYVELLEFEGTLHDRDTGELYDDYIITVVDRAEVLRKEKRPAWRRNGYKVKSGWRKRASNSYPMGPLANLVGMQYRVDHLQNATADARDLTLMPPLIVKGEMSGEDVAWAPFAKFYMEPDGDIRPLFTGANTQSMEAELHFLLGAMEEFAGAPKEAMGIRTAGEKTAHEVQTLSAAAGRIFQEKVTQFEIEILEPLLNNMLELAVRNMRGADIVRVMDDDLGVATFMTITKEDITAKGKLRPIGARHFAQQAQIMQNLTGIASSGIWAKIEPHLGDKAMARLVEDLLQLQRFDLYADNKGVIDKIETQRLMQEGQESLAAEQMTGMPEDEAPPM